MVFLNFRDSGQIFSAEFRIFIRYLLFLFTDMYQLTKLIVNLMEEKVSKQQIRKEKI